MQCLPFGVFDGVPVTRCTLGNTMRFDALLCGPAQGELVLLLHGFPQFADSWLPIMPHLARAGYRAVAVDQRGYSPGARPAHVQDYTLANLVGDTLAFADELGATRLHLVGHDWGGLVAWQLAADHPARLRSLTVLSTPHPEAFRATLRKDFDQRNRSKYLLLFRMPKGIPERVLLGLGGAVLRRVYQGKLTARQVESNLRRLAAPGVMTAALNWYRALETCGHTSTVHVPCLYLWGDRDIALGETAALRTASFVLGKYRFERLSGLSHWLVDEAPATIATMLVEHLAASRASGRPPMNPDALERHPGPTVRPTEPPHPISRHRIPAPPHPPILSRIASQRCLWNTCERTHSRRCRNGSRGRGSFCQGSGRTVR